LLDGEIVVFLFLKPTYLQEFNGNVLLFNYTSFYTKAHAADATRK